MPFTKKMVGILLSRMPSVARPANEHRQAKEIYTAGVLKVSLGLFGSELTIAVPYSTTAAACPFVPRVLAPLQIVLPLGGRRVEVPHSG